MKILSVKSPQSATLGLYFPVLGKEDEVGNKALTCSAQRSPVGHHGLQ